MNQNEGINVLWVIVDGLEICSIQIHPKAEALLLLLKTAPGS